MPELADEAFAPVITESKEQFHGRVWNVRTDTFEYNGGVLVRDYVEHPGAVAIVAVDEQNRVMLIQQYRHPVGLRDWEIPAGLRDIAGESEQAVAERELEEETGLAASNWRKLVAIAPSPGGNGEIIHIFLARELREVTSTFVREGEESDMKHAWVPIDEVVDAVMSGRFSNGTLAVGILAAERVLREGAA